MPRKLPEHLAIWWLKQDFRLADNPALTAALANHPDVLPVFCFEPSLMAEPEVSAFHIAAQHEAATALDRTLRPRGRRGVLMLHMEAIKAFEWIATQTHIDAIYSHEEVGVMATYGRDLLVAQWCEERNIPWIEHRQTGVFRGLRDRDKRSKLWKEFMLAPTLVPPGEESLSKLVPPTSLDREGVAHKVRPTLKSMGFSLSRAQKLARQPVTEADAETTLDTFLDHRAFNYQRLISSPNTAFEHGSRLSVHLAWGTISGRRTYQMLEARKEEIREDRSIAPKGMLRSLASFGSRLHWRDHFTQRLESAVEMEFFALHPSFEDFYDKDVNEEMLAAWVEGRTGFPMVDACIRCAQVTGFVNFRMRAMITSTGTHLMKLDWRALHPPMAKLWADYAPGIHLSQLQMQAGVVGINTVRTYNPQRQIITQDPEAVFIKTWVPELRECDPEAIAAHQDEPLEGVDYPAPVVDYREAARSHRSAYYTVKGKKETRALTEHVLANHGSRKSPRSRKKPKKKAASEKAAPPNQLQA